MKYTRVFILAILVMCLAPCDYAQDFDHYHFTQDNGLPSNHVYGMITDHLGYLWICTDKGIAKYNGYSFRYFDESDGLISDDVWEMVEDTRGRIWLASFASKMGYIANDKYHRVELAYPRKVVFPFDIRPGSNGIVFKSEAYLEGGAKQELCYSRGDTIFSKPIKWINEGNEDIGEKYSSHGVWREDGLEYSALMGNYIYRYDFSDSNRLFQTKLVAQSRVKIRDTTSKVYTDTRNYRFGHHVLSFNATPKVFLTNLETGEITRAQLNLSGDTVIRHIHYEKEKNANENNINVISDRFISTFRMQGDNITRGSSYSIRALAGPAANAKAITTFHKKGNWFMLGSLTQGAWRVGRQTLPVKDTDTLGKMGKLIGQFNDSLTFWFDKSDNIFSVRSASGAVIQLEHPALSSAGLVEHLAGDTFLIYARYPFYYLHAKKSVISVILVSKSMSGLYGGVKTPSEFRTITQYGYYHTGALFEESKSLVVDANRYNGIVCNYKTGTVICYNKERIITEDKQGKLQVIKDGEKLWGVDVGDVHCVTVDSLFGNVFLVGKDRLFLLDLARRKCTPICKDVVLRDVASFFVSKDMLCVVWAYGLLMAKIAGPGLLGKTVKETDPVKFRQVSAAFINGNTLKLVGENTISTICIPDFRQSLSPAYGEGKHQFIISTSDSTYILKQGDTIFLHQTESKFLIDVVNPDGIGKLKFFVAIGNGEKEQLLNSNEVFVPKDLKPGRFVDFRIRASDATWISESLPVVVYILPKWYQTTTGRLALWAMITAVALLFVLFTVILTRRIVLKRNERRQAQTELELKSIYAQINPHFIFNTLNSALLLISKNRMDEAYTHVSKFSKLLRSYLRSSRNKFVTINDEAANLRNYIELQQARFKNRFVYEVIVDKLVEERNMSIPSLLIQPFVENAINHGLLPLSEVGRLIVSFHFDPHTNIVTCKIDDNGIGREQSKMDRLGREEVKESYGDLIINELVQAFNKYEKMNVHVSYYDKKNPETGTVVTINIKNPHYES